MKAFTQSLLVASLVTVATSAAAVNTHKEAELDYIRYVFTYQYEAGMDISRQAYAKTQRQLLSDLSQGIQHQAAYNLYQTASDTQWAISQENNEAEIVRR